MPLKNLMHRLVDRRDCLRLGALTCFGLAGGPLWSSPRPQARARSCVVVWLNGGPSHIDTFDLKPDAPREVRGEFRPIATAVDGLQICEHLPRTAKVMDRCALLRAVTSPEGNHDRATSYMLTGWRPTPALEYPALGSVAAKAAGGQEALPRYIAVPAEIEYAGAGYLTAAYEPFAVGSDPGGAGFRVRDLEPRVASDRFERRRSMLRGVDELGWARRGAAPKAAEARDANLAQAFRLITSAGARAAFDLASEPARARDRYGHTRIGQSCLLARRLVEAGVRFITVNDNGWDTHQSIFKELSTGFPGKLPELDMAFSSLVSDLDERGLLDTTLVVLMGDFGRTPKLNSAGGRDHWPRASSVVLSGGGVRRGVVYGSTDATAELPASDAVEPEDLAATIYACLGIDPQSEERTAEGRPVRILGRGSAIAPILL